MWYLLNFDKYITSAKTKNDIINRLSLDVKRCRAGVYETKDGIYSLINESELRKLVMLYEIIQNQIKEANKPC